MKKFLLLMLIVVCLFPMNAHAKTAERQIEQKTYFSMRTKTVKIGNRYRVDVFWRGKKIANYKFNCKPQVQFIMHDQLTWKMLERRKNKVLFIEISKGTQLNTKGDGKIETKDPYYNYISYKRCGFRKGDKIRTYCIFNPYTNWEDDVIERYDEKIN